MLHKEMIKGKVSESLANWSSYTGLVRNCAFDFELALVVKGEVEAARGLREDIEGMRVACAQNTQTVYCNRTGQPIGVGFVRGHGLEFSASIAPQWLKTGPDSLAQHVKETPVAYTVYLIGKTLGKIQHEGNDGIEAVNNRVSVLAGCYELLTSGRGFDDNGLSNFISVLQTALWINSKLGKVSVSTDFGAMYAINTKELQTITDAVLTAKAEDAPALQELFVKWIGNVTGRLVGQTLPIGNGIDALDKIEAMIAGAVKDVNALIAGRSSITEIGNVAVGAEFSNIPQARKAKRANWGKTIVKNKKVNETADALGDIFGDIG